MSQIKRYFHQITRSFINKNYSGIYILILSASLISAAPLLSQAPGGLIKLKKPDETDQAYKARMRKAYLHLSGSGINNNSLNEIFEYPSLKTLILKSTQVNGGGLSIIRQHPEINYLSLERTYIGDGSVSIISGMKSLYMLDLSYTGVSDAGLQRLKNNSISFINLSGNNLSANSPRYIVENFPNLRRLDLMSVPLTDDSIAMLTGRKSMKELTEEISKDTGGREEDYFTKPKKNVKLENRGLKKLIDINIAGAEITERGLAALSILKDIKILDLAATNIKPEGYGHLRRFKNLEVLSISGTSIGDSEIDLLNDLKKLKVLSLENTAISDRGLKKLSKHPSLYSVYLKDSLVTQKGIDKFKEKKPLCKIDHSKFKADGI